jgi:hypothetical protein
MFIQKNVILYIENIFFCLTKHNDKSHDKYVDKK